MQNLASNIQLSCARVLILHSFSCSQAAAVQQWYTTTAYSTYSSERNFDILLPAYGQQPRGLRNAAHVDNLLLFCDEHFKRFAIGQESSLIYSELIICIWFFRLTTFWRRLLESRILPSSNDLSKCDIDERCIMRCCEVGLHGASVIGG